MGGIALIAENVDRQMADGTRNTRAIEVEGRKFRGLNVLPGIHLHARDHGEKIFSAQPVAPCRPQQCARNEMTRGSAVNRVDLLSPDGKSRELLGSRLLAVGNVVDFAAERVDCIHRIAAVSRQQAHSPVERSPGGLDSMPDRVAQRVFVHAIGCSTERRITHLRNLPDTPIRKATKKSNLCNLTRIARGSPCRKRRSSLSASSTMTALSHRSPGETTSGGKLRALSISAVVRSRRPSKTRRKAGLAAPPASTSTLVPSAVRSSRGT